MVTDMAVVEGIELTGSKRPSCFIIQSDSAPKNTDSSVFYTEIETLKY